MAGIDGEGDTLGQADGSMREKHSQATGFMDVAGQNTEEQGDADPGRWRRRQIQLLAFLRRWNVGRKSAAGIDRRSAYGM